VAQCVIKKGINAAGVWYRLEAFTHVGLNSRCELCCRWGHIENKCGSKPMFSYCSGHHWKSDHKCNVVGCTAKQGSLCGHTLEKCPNYKGNYIVLSSRCVKKSKAAKVAWHSRKIGIPGQAPKSGAMDMAMGTKRVVQGPRPSGGVAGAGGSDKEEMADVEKEEATGEARDVMMTETKTKIATTTATETEIKIEAVALATND